MNSYPPIVRRRASDPKDSELMRKLFQGEYSAVIIENVVSRSGCQDMIKRVQSAGLQRAVLPEFLVAGGLLMFTDDFQQYRIANQALLTELSESSVLERLLEQFTKLSEHAQVFEPKANAAAAPFSVRELLPGGEIALHSEHDRWPGMDVFRRLLDLSTQLSYYLLLQSGEEGGVLQFVSPTPNGLQWRIPGPEAIPLNDGDLIIFDGGRINHQVTRLEGSRSRWTLGGFASLTADQVHIWS